MKVRLLIPGAFAIILGAHPVSANNSPEQIAFFEKKIRPVLAENCYECHSTDAKKIGGKLLLDTRKGMLDGGESGPSLNLENIDLSLVLQALKWEGDLEMPPEEPLSQTVIADFRKWIEMGAPDPRSSEESKIEERTYEEGALWSFEPVRPPNTPKVKNQTWPAGSIDRFVLAKLEKQGVSPAPEAPARTLIRRLFIDLTGLPPSPEEVKKFTAACESDADSATADLVDRLLASPQFGERWGRHWLDVARYAESNGNDGLSRNPTFPHAWRYRDYVIDAWNRDVPYDRFLTEQIAGDLLPYDSPEEHDSNRVATGFLALTAKPAKAMNNNFDMDVVADQIDVVSRGVMGISVACARCHDHKFDPVPTRDYYAMAGIFTSTETMWGVAGNEKLTAPPTDLFVLDAAPFIPPPADFVETVILKESNTGKPKELPKPKWKPGTPLAMGARDIKKPADCKINLKGDSKKLGEAVPRGFLNAYPIPAPAIPVDQSGRLELAQWLTSGEHPQTARVMANRIWMHLFGKGIVGTPDDFGVYGERPTHPELLDHLATRFVENGWSMKKLIRDIVLSRTYRLDSIAPETTLAADPENALYSRHDRRRLDAESLRDSILAVSGQLDLTPGEGSLIRYRDILVNLAGNLHEPSSHRSIYLCYLRNSPPPELAAFDLPDFLSIVGKRDESMIPSHALYLYNSPFVVDQSQHFAESVLSGNLPGDPARIQSLYRRALLREPDPEELYRAQELLEAANSETGSQTAAWACLCQALFTTNEFRYID